MSIKVQFFASDSLNRKISDERIEEIADQCSSWFTPAGSKIKERMLDHGAFARSIISETDVLQQKDLRDFGTSVTKVTFDGSALVVSAIPFADVIKPT